MFKSYLSNIFKIETKIATNKCKLAKHNIKWKFYKVKFNKNKFSTI